MIHALTRTAHRLDLWLQSRLGRPYNLMLGVGLSIEIVHRLTELPGRMGEAPRLVGAILLITMNLGLLVHQVGELSHHFGRRSAVAAGDEAGEPAGRRRPGRRRSEV